jgi:(p)ppGpp synthase/HD superfamily hydrolase
MARRSRTCSTSPHVYDGTVRPTIEDALSVAIEAHRGQLYPAPSPEPFILHPLRVMLGVESKPAQIVALLHDVVEDSGLTLRDLRDRGFDAATLDAVDHLTRRDGENYQNYIRRVGRNPLAREVKLSDLADNLTNNRALPPTADNLARIARYELATATLRAFSN